MDQYQIYNYLKRRKGFVSTQEIALKCNMNPNNCIKKLHKLNKFGYVEMKRYLKGGQRTQQLHWKAIIKKTRRVRKK